MFFDDRQSCANDVVFPPCIKEGKQFRSHSKATIYAAVADSCIERVDLLYVVIGDRDASPCLNYLERKR